MWLTEEFWKRTGGDRNQLLDKIEHSEGLDYLKVQDECFTEATGEQGRLQKWLRDVLYPNR